MDESSFVSFSVSRDEVCTLLKESNQDKCIRYQHGVFFSMMARDKRTQEVFFSDFILNSAI